MSKDTGLETSAGQSLKEVANRSIRAILERKYSQDDVSRLISVCHNLAIPYLTSRLGRDVILKRTLELDVKDFAYDCIADLFAYAQSGEFPHINAYFAAYPPHKLSQEEILTHLRRLVFSHVNHGIFRLYNEVDPSLGKILRNIKLALQQFDSLRLIERFGEPCLTPSAGDNLLQLRPLEVEDLEAGLRSYLRGSENVPYMLGKLALFLQEQSTASRVVPLSAVGIVFRSIYTSRMENEEPATIVEQKIETERLAEVVRVSVETVRGKMASQYAKKKRIHRTVLEVYFKVIEKRLMLTFSGDGYEKGLRELLREDFKNMSEKEYRARHRSRLEYLSRLTGEEVARRLKRK